MTVFSFWPRKIVWCWIINASSAFILAELAKLWAAKSAECGCNDWGDCDCKLPLKRPLIDIALFAESSLVATINLEVF